jgi:hypothetical protein
MTRKWAVSGLVAALVVVQSCGESSTSPGPGGGTVQFATADIDLSGARDTTVAISNTSSVVMGPLQLVPLAVRNTAGDIIPGPTLQVSPSAIPTLNPGSTVLVTLNVTAPANTPDGDYQVGLEARSDAEFLARTTLRFRVTATGPAGNSITINSGPTAFVRGDVVQFGAEVLDSAGTAIPNASVQWSVLGQGLFAADGRFVGYETGTLQVIARSGTAADTMAVTVSPRTLSGSFTVRGTGSAVAGCDRATQWTSDLWVHGGVLYSGTHSGGCGKFYSWSLANPDAPVKSDSLTLDARVVNDVKIRSDGTLGIITHEGSNDLLNGITLLDLSSPEHPTAIARYTDGLHAGIHNVWIEGDYAYLVTDGTDPVSGGLRILDVSNPAVPVEVAQYFGGGSTFLHDVYVRDGLAILSHWSTGLIILDVGHGVAGGSPTNPVEVSRISIPGYLVHNAWYWPAAGYIFIGDEINTPGRMRVIDVNDLTQPVEVASYNVSGAAPHNFWLDEGRGILYLAWYQGGVRALDVSGALMGELERGGREIANTQYGGAMTWAPQLVGNRIYVSDLFDGLRVLEGDF